MDCASWAIQLGNDEPVFDTLTVVKAGANRTADIVARAAEHQVNLRVDSAQCRSALEPWAFL